MIFTHDRGLFRIYQDEITRRKNFNRLENWKVIELYSIVEPSGIHSPKLIEDESLIAKAKQHLYECRIPECANTLRRCCEKEIKRILPLNKRIHISREGEERIDHDLNSLMNDFKKYVSYDCKMTPLEHLFPGIDTDRKLILNPFSHDDLETSFYRGELKSLIADIEMLCNIQSKCEYTERDIMTVKMKMIIKKCRPDGSVFQEWVEFNLLEKLYVLEFEGVKYHNNPKILILNHSSHTMLDKLKPNKSSSIRKVYDRLYQAVLPGIKSNYLLDIIEKV